MAKLNLPQDHPAVEGLSRAKIKLMLMPQCAFYTTLILQAPVHWISADELETAATDGINLFFNPEFFLGLDPDQRIFLILHEVMHNVYDHLTRVGFRDPTTWNEAGDFVINDELIQRNFKMPPVGLHDTQYRGMSTDEVYSILIDKKNKGGSNQPTPWPDLMPPPPSNGSGDPSQGQPGMGGVQQPTPAEIDENTKNTVTAAVQASKMAKEKPGAIPGNIERDLDKLLHPKLPWDKILARFLFAMGRDDYSWRKPNRRYISQGLIMPSQYSETMDCIAFAIDTSGSVSDDDFNRFISEIGYVFKRHNPKEIEIMQFDGVLQSHDRVCSPQDFMKLKFKGGGGTRIEPVLEAYVKSKSKALIILTDGYLHQDIKYDPKKPVVWCIYNNPNFVPLFGTAIHFEN